VPNILIALFLALSLHAQPDTQKPWTDNDYQLSASVGLLDEEPIDQDLTYAPQAGANNSHNNTSKKQPAAKLILRFGGNLKFGDPFKAWVLEVGGLRSTQLSLSLQTTTPADKCECPSNLVVSNGVQDDCATVVETPTYLAVANKLFSQEERADIVALVAADPECGDLIGGTGGFRKGMAKSGGARVVYIWSNEGFPVFLITVLPKNEKENLSMVEERAQETC